jgi:mRNA-degrading endonuclease RelE of RelBE toxin-antitoxin system
MNHIVTIKRKVEKNLPRLPQNVRERFYVLVKRLEFEGPTGGHVFPNYGKLSDNEYHCHLTHHYVACWLYEKGTIIIEVYYVGSRENSPY